MKKAAAQIQAANFDDSHNDASARQQIEAVMKAKAEGRLTYKPLHEIAAKYNFDAR